MSKISREEAKKKIKALHCIFCFTKMRGESCDECEYKMAIEALSQPEIVMCAECMFWEEDFSDDCGCGWCRNISRDGCKQQTDKDDYCYYSERRTDD